MLRLCLASLCVSTLTTTLGVSAQGAPETVANRLVGCFRNDDTNPLVTNLGSFEDLGRLSTLQGTIEGCLELCDKQSLDMCGLAAPNPLQGTPGLCLGADFSIGFREWRRTADAPDANCSAPCPVVGNIPGGCGGMPAPPTSPGGFVTVYRIGNGTRWGHHRHTEGVSATTIVTGQLVGATPVPSARNATATMAADSSTPIIDPTTGRASTNQQQPPTTTIIQVAEDAHKNWDHFRRRKKIIIAAVSVVAFLAVFAASVVMYHSRRGRSRRNRNPSIRGGDDGDNPPQMQSDSYLGLIGNNPDASISRESVASSRMLHPLSATASSMSLISTPPQALSRKPTLACLLEPRAMTPENIAHRVPSFTGPEEAQSGGFSMNYMAAYGQRAQVAPWEAMERNK
ncbi:uncharacterized protein EV422DRAFT_417205 [Fimicolochytrium jonesii]|uniref:uncharacterized protein n=1 Tax=Fimicolochytrium jonesii TaxID=1396493 RepID=UPI0022FDF16D|nr:uncharacterized protein EV422DRAFT_417205 [Fimicolochytrium jonesii]KAI8822105.1 hypothetical protein EV422DRAFT_417205 [Fimicolochytrium jonesii]